MVLRCVVQAPPLRVSSIVARVVDGRRGAAVTPDDAVWLVEASKDADDGAAAAAWSAMTALCCTGKKSKNRTRLAAANAFAAAASTLMRDDVCDGTLAACLRAVANLCGGEQDDSVHAANIRAALVGRDNGFAVAVVGVLMRVECSLDVASSGSLVLSRLSRDVCGRRAVAEAGSVSALFGLMRRYTGAAAAEVHLNCSAALSRLGWKVPDEIARVSASLMHACELLNAEALDDGTVRVRCGVLPAFTRSRAVARCQ